jgi:alcohol dehydrogenase (cytochrome c)
VKPTRNFPGTRRRHARRPSSVRRDLHADRVAAELAHLFRDHLSQRHSSLAQFASQRQRTWNCNGSFRPSPSMNSRRRLSWSMSALHREAPNDIVALDAATGRIFWVYSYTPSPLARPCCGRVNRGVGDPGRHAVHGTDRRALVAIDAPQRASSLDVEVASGQSGYALTVAPLGVKDKIIRRDCRWRILVSAAFSPPTTRALGKHVWKFNNIPGPGEPERYLGGDSWKRGGGDPVWVTGSEI